MAAAGGRGGGGPKARVGRVSVEGLWEGGKDRTVDAPFGRRDWLGQPVSYERGTPVGVRPAAPLNSVAPKVVARVSVTGEGLRAEGMAAGGGDSFRTGRSDA